MPPTSPRKPVKRVFQPLPKNTFWIEHDAYDRRVWEHLRAEAPSLRELESVGSPCCLTSVRCCKIFFLCYSNSTQSITRTAKFCPARCSIAIFSRAIHNGAQYEFLREQTLLNEAHAGLSTLILGERLLAISVKRNC
jgi:hypothetical protein